MADPQTPTTSPLTEDAAHGASEPWNGLDVVLAVAAFPVFLAALMFATSGMTIALAHRSSRRRLLWSSLAIEVVLVALVVFLIVR